MKIGTKVLGAVLLASVSVGSFTNVAYAASHVHENGKSYVVDWDNYDYSNGLEGSFTLEDEYGNKPIFSQNDQKEWISPILKVKGSIISGFEFKYLNFKFNFDNVKVYDCETKEEITNGFLKAGQRIYIVSNEDPVNLRLSISPILIAEN
ncbi:hypothetical protein ACSXC4_15505 (plasmid) [Clostridium perfringens]|uniref:Uncharacterized protein n=2 Tax=Clostridium perfringens TaxID=1502 RepID=A0A0N7BVE2_CLOPF|nr:MULTISPECIES: hypothetical protein [Clostridium]AKF16656.1 hypothetical protein [Clostridium perfringens]AMN30660.1 hypothetical protein JFP838_pC0078 [Clostridium perfringens]AMN30739.1 hypothetical protein JFP55_pF0075 [Clostridium perfringens]MDK7591377.1 hypothetical protein [Clostridium sp. UMB9555B]MDK7629515.1 hypothetical protein [Clostridium sp. UMB9555A]